MSAEKADSKAPITIKIYANRRLYNTAKSSYVTLDHLAEMVREGEDFVVYDAKSGDDITRSVLTQIIFEEEAKGQYMLPTNFLRQLIRLYGDTLQGVVPSYLDASMNTFAHNQEKMREQMKAAFGANPALANFESLARTNMEWFENAMRMFAPFAQGAGGSLPSFDAPKGDGGAEKPAEKSGKDDIEALKAQLREMQSRLDDIVKKS
jgi:polyhydroxyalkanoate synthesis repressor PhaR